MAKAFPTPAWFPDWRGQAAAVVASGPSTKRAGVEQLRGKFRVIAIKENVELCPWADLVYGCDRPWWRNAAGLPGYHGLKVSAAQQLRGPFPEINLVTVRESVNKILIDEPGVIGSGANSGFQALNLAVQFGARRLLLTGFDMSMDVSVHWFGRSRGQGRSNPGEWNFRGWRQAFEGVAKALESMGVEVVNASEYTALTCFRKVTIAQMIAEWDL